MVEREDVAIARFYTWIVLILAVLYVGGLVPVLRDVATALSALMLAGGLLAICYYGRHLIRRFAGGYWRALLGRTDT